MTHIQARKYKGTMENLTREITILRNLPNFKMRSIGSFVFLDHIIEKEYAAKTPEMPDGSFAHPHRGIATFSYLFEGGVHHLDSAGGEGKVYSGGIQWMNAGNGIVHDEFLPYDFQQSGGRFHGLQFWINLPAKNKAEKPDYRAVQSEDVPELNLAKEAGKLRVLLGAFEGLESQIPNFTEQFMYHIQLNSNDKVRIPANLGWEYGVYPVNGNIVVDDNLTIDGREVAQLFDFGEFIEFHNGGDQSTDFMLFGGEPYGEPMAFHGPFIMNHESEIAGAYRDYQMGKYGEIDYKKVKI